MELGIILHKLQGTNIFIVDVGWGQVRYFVSNEQYNIGDYVLYKDIFFETDYDQDEFYLSREDWINSALSEDDNSKSNRINVICNLNECENLGNVRFDLFTLYSSRTNIVIARRDLFVYWEGYKDGEKIKYDGRKTFDEKSNALLFIKYAEPRYLLPDEKDFFKAYSDAREYVEKLDIPKMIEEIKVEFHTSCFTRRGSDNVLITRKKIECNMSEHYAFHHIDSYLDNFFPKYSEELYHSKDDDCDFIHPNFENSKVIKNIDGSVDYEKAKYEGLDIDDFCANKTNELRQVALKNFERYNKDEHINSIAYSHLYWSKIYNYNEDNNFVMKMKGLAELIWGYRHEKLLEQLNIDNYRKLIKYNNSLHPIPPSPEYEYFDVIRELKLLDKS